MRVLYWTELFWPYIGGVEVLSAPLLAALSARGHEFTVVTSHGSLDLPDRECRDGVPIYRYPFQTALAAGGPGQIHRLLQQVARLKRAVRPQLIHVQLTDPSIFFHLQTAAACSAPDLLSVHVAPPAMAAGHDTLLGRAFRSAAWITASSRAILADVQASAPDTRRRSSVMYPCLPAPAVTAEPLPFEEPRVLCAGRLVADKGFDVALAAWALLRGRFPRARLILVGDGPGRARLAEQAAALGIATSVDFAGWARPEAMPALVNSATIVLLPSRWREAFGLIALQAAQMGRPVVATRVGGVPEIVLDGETGILVDKEDSEAMAEALAFLLQQPAVARRLGLAGWRRARDAFAWDRYVDAHDLLYRRLTEEFAHAGACRPIRT